MLATYMERFPHARILLLSTTNVAVDQALVAVDKQLETGGSATWVHRRGCKRIGNNFRAGFYEGRQHLLPAQDEVTLRELAMHQAQRPDPTDAHAYSIWKTRETQLRSRLKRNQQMVIENCRLAAMTTTAAVFHFDVLEARGGYDIVVFDESSQVSLAHAFMLAPLGQRRLYTGDPMQLSPIVQSANPMTLKWLGKSVFQRVDLASPMMCQLDEQWRMAQPICNVVSQLFYEGRLRVASDAANDPAWKRERELVPLKGLPARAIHVESIVHDGQWSAKYKGPIRFESAKRIVTLVESLLSHVEPDDIVVITPFRAQRALIRSLLRRDGTKGVSVSTVHRAQGSERHTVIFDPVQGDSEFLTGPEADRLVNVAISRAQARLILLLSPVDRNHPKLSQVRVPIRRYKTRCQRYSDSLVNPTLGLSRMHGRQDNRHRQDDVPLRKDRQRRNSLLRYSFAIRRNYRHRLAAASKNLRLSKLELIVSVYWFAGRKSRLCRSKVFHLRLLLMKGRSRDSNLIRMTTQESIGPKNREVLRTGGGAPVIRGGGAERDGRSRQ